MILSEPAGATAWSGLLNQHYAGRGTGHLYTLLACGCLAPAAFPTRITRTCRPLTARLAELALVVLGGTAAMSAIAACSAAGQADPPGTGDAPPATLAEPSPDATAQVIGAYKGYFLALEAAEPQPRQVTVLTPYVAQPYLEHVLTEMAAYRARGEIAWGYLVPHVTSVQVDGSKAIVRDCQDASNAWLVSAATGKVIPGTTGSARTFLVASLARGGDGRWRLTMLAHVAGSCSRVPSPP